jgi:hypothetical protein
MSGWLLFFLFLSLVGFPSSERTSTWSGATVVATSLVWGSVCLGLLAGALRTGGYL